MPGKSENFEELWNVRRCFSIIENALNSPENVKTYKNLNISLLFKIGEYNWLIRSNNDKNDKNDKNDNNNNYNNKTFIVRELTKATGFLIENPVECMVLLL